MLNGLLPYCLENSVPYDPMNQVHPGPTEPVDRIPTDATQARTGNTEREQETWFAGIEEGQRRTEHNAAVRSAWMPIESAPKDGTEIWAYNGEQARMKWIEGECYALWIWADDLLSDADPNPEQPTHWQPLPAAPGVPPASAQDDAKDEHSDTYGMNLGERIAHVGGRTNAQGYTEFGSPMAVNALIQHVLRDIDWTRQDDDGAYQARYRLPGGQWSSWGHVVCGVKGHEQELRYLPGARRPAPTAGDARAALTKVESLQRYGFGYADDGNGARYLSSLKRDDGAFLRRDEVLAAIAAQQGEGGGV
ncbi:hypothetical protein AZ20_4230 [Bordetella bronchiseptica E014]|uniref:DUF551 domain-containing protein n=1 Tax=Bordetella bronchiseptica TaxID=518 RepID=UPI00049F484F|nr:DUF551 domain-containing protein [Bordetella bronchiseptica]KDC22995.1 hypothetical protein AZ20_4230 [Bordetella bronchiseptica E014]